MAGWRGHAARPGRACGLIGWAHDAGVATRAAVLALDTLLFGVAALAAGRQMPGLWAALIMMGGSPLRPCLPVPLQASALSAVS